MRRLHTEHRLKIPCKPEARPAVQQRETFIEVLSDQGLRVKNWRHGSQPMSTHGLRKCKIPRKSQQIIEGL